MKNEKPARVAKITRPQVISHVRQVFESARIMRVTHGELHASFMRGVMGELSSVTPAGRRRYSESDRSFARGAFDALWPDVWREMYFVYRDKSGQIFGTDRTAKFWPYWQDHCKGSEMDAMERGHAWPPRSPAEIEQPHMFTEWSHSMTADKGE